MKEECCSSTAGLSMKYFCVHLWDLLGFMLVADLAVVSKALTYRPGWSCSCLGWVKKGFWVESTLKQLFSRCWLPSPETFLRLSCVTEQLCKYRVSLQVLHAETLCSLMGVLCMGVLCMGKILKSKTRSWTCVLVMLTDIKVFAGFNYMIRSL